MENSQPGPAVSGVVVSTFHVQPLGCCRLPCTVQGRVPVHNESDLRGYLIWCESCGLEPLVATRPHVELDVRWPNEPAESPPLGLTHLPFEALLTSAKQSPNGCDSALVTRLDLLGLRIFEATGGNIEDLGEEHGHHVLRVRGKGDKIVLGPLPPAGGGAAVRAIGDRGTGAILLTSRGTRMDRHTFVTIMLDAGVDLRDVPIAASHADPRTLGCAD